jgi:glycosyltransferase involved in cell wall biosynthesis
MIEEKPGRTFVTFFPNCENVHLTKDVGMMGYILHRDFGYDSYIICNKNGEYPNLTTEVPGLRLLFMRDNQNNSFQNFYLWLFKKKPLLADRINEIFNVLTALPMLIKHGKQIDVFQLYHFKIESILMALVYRLVNKKGITHIKLDMNEDHIMQFEKTPGKHSLMYEFLLKLMRLSYINIFTIENREFLQRVIKTHPVLLYFKSDFHYLPNGIDVEKLKEYKDNFNEKENIILHVGRIGNNTKGSETILEAFSKISRDFPTWKLVLIGNMEESFKEYFSNYLRNNKEISNKVLFTGFISSRELLYEYYRRAKILAFPSRSESFGLVALEAGFFGNVIVGTDIPPTREVTNYGKIGYLCPVDDIWCFKETLGHVLSHEDELKEKSEITSEFIKDHFDWHKICEELNNYIMQSAI